MSSTKAFFAFLGAIAIYIIGGFLLHTLATAVFVEPKTTLFSMAVIETMSYCAVPVILCAILHTQFTLFWLLIGAVNGGIELFLMSKYWDGVISDGGMLAWGIVYAIVNIAMTWFTFLPEGED